MPFPQIADINNDGTPDVLVTNHEPSGSVFACISPGSTSPLLIFTFNIQSQAHLPTPPSPPLRFEISILPNSTAVASKVLPLVHLRARLFDGTYSTRWLPT